MPTSSCNSHQEHLNRIRQSHQLLIAKVLGNRSRLNQTTKPAEHDKITRQASGTEWGNASGETALSSTEFTTSSFDDDDHVAQNFVQEVENTIIRHNEKIKTLKDVLASHEHQAKLRYISRNKFGALIAIRMAHSCRDKLELQETIRHNLLAFLAAIREKSFAGDIKDGREHLQSILDTRSTTEALKTEIDNDTLLEQIKQLISGDQ